MTILTHKNKIHQITDTWNKDHGSQKSKVKCKMSETKDTECMDFEIGNGIG